MFLYVAKIYKKSKLMYLYLDLKLYLMIKYNHTCLYMNNHVFINVYGKEGMRYWLIKRMELLIN